MTTNDLPRLNSKQVKKVCKLIEERCCNYDEGNCLLLDHGYCSVCPQSISRTLNCKWFRNAVLPNNQSLEAEILRQQPIRRCTICGKTMYVTDSRTKYCKTCAEVQRRKQQADWVRKKRADMSTL